MRHCAVSIDVDPISCYHRIHGLGPAPAALEDMIMRRCVPRFAELFARRGIPATFFIVARDLDPHVMGERARASRELVRELAGAGHEIGNHSYSHPYELARMSDVEVGSEIERAHHILEHASGDAVVGFRAPGYDLSACMLEHLMRLGYRYDSSIFPAPGYYAAKAAIMGVLRLAGKKSGAVLTDPRALVAPSTPYRPAVGAPWRRGQAPVVELPIAVTRFGRVPVIGTSLLLAPAWLRSRWLRAMESREFFNFELHGIDLADAEADGIPAELIARQPDLRVPLAIKRRRLDEILDRLAGSFEFVRLRDVAMTVQRQV
jgi:peptidoglycan-N-acetylglucosamine deacetylase